ncbi:MAG TPA: alginate lyase family protein [Pseudomonadales bacterium]
MINKISLFYHTLRYLSVEQFLYLVLYRLKSKYNKRKIVPVDSFDDIKTLSLIDGVENKKNKYADSYFLFLNEKQHIDLLKFKWASNNQSKLWRYNLHYFDWLKDKDINFNTEQQKILINLWIDNCRPVQEDAWEPYPVSLRVVNWIKYFIRLKQSGSDIPENWAVSLYEQCSWLNKNIEYHLRANHLFKNSVALIFAGSYFQGETAKKWFRQGIDIFSKEITEQFHQDGGHFERSPMYHALCLEDVLDTYNILVNTEGNKQNDATMEAIKSFLPKGFSYLKSVTFPDGEVSYLGDSVKGIAATYEELKAYYFRIFSSYPEESQAETNNTQASNASLFKKTGVFTYEDSRQKTILNLGKPSPDYQPGHSHCDLFSYELFAKKINSRLVVDSGVCEYQRGKYRHYCRSTRAHNTVMVNHLDQNEIWGEFRVARRVSSVEYQCSISPDKTVTAINMSHDGYRRIGRHVRHHRHINFSDQEMTVADKVTGQGVSEMVSYIHLHPDINIEKKSSARMLLNKGSQSLGEINIESGQMTIEKGWYFPEFGIKQSNLVLAIEQDHSALFETRYALKLYSN